MINLMLLIHSKVYQPTDQQLSHVQLCYGVPPDVDGMIFKSKRVITQWPYIALWAKYIFDIIHHAHTAYLRLTPRLCTTLKGLDAFSRL